MERIRPRAAPRPLRQAWPQAAIENAALRIGQGFLTHPDNDHVRRGLRYRSLSVDQFFAKVRLMALDTLFALFAASRSGDGAASLSPNKQLKTDDSDSSSKGIDGELFWSISSDDLRAAALELAFEEGDPSRPIDFSAVDVRSLGVAHEWLMQCQPSVDRKRSFSLNSRTGKGRKRSGSYFTPPELVELLLDHSLEPILAEAARNNDPVASILRLRLIDPACGVGHFLLPAARRIARALANLSDPTFGDERSTLVLAMTSCVFGVDTDPIAVRLCKQILWLETGAFDMPLTTLNENVRCADGLIDLARREPDNFQGFDLVMGNPPFVNAIEGGVAEREKKKLRRRFPRVGGTADLAFYFLERSLTLARQGGRIAMVQPRAALNAPALTALRRHPRDGFAPNLIFAPGRADFFPGAAVFISLIVLGPDASCKVGQGRDPESAVWRTGTIDDDNWWRASETLISPGLRAQSTSRRIGDIFDVSASMTAGDAYELQAFLVEARTGADLKLVTTGLIDPDVCRWGTSVCRYLKRDWTFPRVVRDNRQSPSLARRLERSRRPKLLVAGLSRRVECFLDEACQYTGAVSTYSIFHPEDDIDQLAALKNQLLSPSATELFRAELGGNALGGGNTTMTRKFLESFPLEN